jgi:hypothetical protein
LRKVTPPGLTAEREPKPHDSARFWAAIAGAALALALASASIAAAIFSAPLPKNVIPYGYSTLFGRVVSLDWYSDRWFVAVSVAFFLLAAALWAYGFRLKK